MNIIIVGCGKVGSTLARSLSMENHNITLIDTNESAVNKVISEVDCNGIVGNGALLNVLIEAFVENCDFMIACTDSDEINILTCLMARKKSKCRTIARIRNPEYAKQVSYIMDELDISLTINPDLATAHEIVRLIRYPASITSDTFFKGRMHLLKVEIPENSQLVGYKLSDIYSRFHCSIVVCVIERKDEIIVPKGYDEIKAGDKICFVGDHNNIISFFDIIGYPYRQIKTFIIVGASRIAKYLIKILRGNENKINIKLIDSDKKKCEEFAAEFPDVSIVCADATDKNILVKEGINDVDSFITLTGIDEENIILSLLAKNNKDCRIITKINHLNFIDSLATLNIGSSVNPVNIASDFIVSYLRASYSAASSNIDTLYKICDEKVEAIGLHLKKDCNLLNILFKDLKIKKNVLIAGIYREGKVVIPNGMTYFKNNDKPIIISYGHKILEINDILE